MSVRIGQRQQPRFDQEQYCSIIVPERDRGEVLGGGASPLTKCFAGLRFGEVRVGSFILGDARSRRAGHS
jgi:hypothetical protein